MNSNPNNQFFDSNNNFSTQINSEQTATGSQMSVQNASNQYYGNSEVSLTRQTSVNSHIIQDNLVISQFVPIKFIYRPPNDLCIYHIKCEEISVQLLNDNVSNINFDQNVYLFYYQQQSNNRIYQIVCEIISPSFIVNFLNKTIYGIEIEQNIEREELTFKFDQKENLKFYLTQYLNRFSLN
ncbi:hypothetical protein RclHR1_12170002 [Rhizophagus clarus]|uniref:Uncharacterized protein n=1 Tax=Rhizophagus clarus TaxID=94130 RepID=A0A2Z6QIS9_9GLOM|nr:hypothetical protein RclHR1_12170002 [Rhizophagus clarus]GES91854.1 hypothetical protein GLOIN_2v1783804 [Rhizophagus clarus]